MNELYKLRRKLARELAQSEKDAMLHTVREARRLGDVPPARALREIAAHAKALEPRFESLMTRDQTLGLGVGRAVGHLFSALRHFFFDRLIDTERSFRATLLGLRHGVDAARLLREVALRAGDPRLVRFCDELLVDRLCLLEHAEQTLTWFAEQPAIALRSGFRMALSNGAAGNAAEHVSDQTARCSTSSVSQPNASQSASATPIIRSS